MKTTERLPYRPEGLPACAYADLKIETLLDNEGEILSRTRQVYVYDNRFKSPLVMIKPFVSSADTVRSYNVIMEKLAKHI